MFLTQAEWHPSPATIQKVFPRSRPPTGTRRARRAAPGGLDNSPSQHHPHPWTEQRVGKPLIRPDPAPRGEALEQRDADDVHEGDGDEGHGCEEDDHWA